MKHLTILFFISCISTVFGYEHISSKQIPDWRIVSNELDSSLKKNEAVFTFEIDAHYKNISETVIYSIDDVEKVHYLSDENGIREEVHPGIHRFAFLFTREYHEIFIDSILIGPQRHITIALNFRKTDREYLVKKPVLYLYPEVETNVSLELQPKGDLLFSYPEYKTGWNVTAHPDGTIDFQGDSYNYLFWESEQKNVSALVNPKEGFVVKPEEIVGFLEASLTQFGFTSKERADFITYWGPTMKTKTNLYIYFLFDEDCDAFASLKISPEPTKIARFYMLWAPVKTDFDSTGITPQDIPSFEHDGFTVLEWGGAEVDMSEVQTLTTDIID